MNYKGEGITRNLAKAVEWFGKAADAGHPTAQLNFGTMYSKGDGVPKDLVQAYKWANLAASAKEAGAADFRASLAAMMTPDQIARAEKLSREWKPRLSLR